MRIGYACLAVSVSDTEMKHCLIKNANEDRLSDLIEKNMKALEHLIDYNIENDIRLFRISSDLIPFGSNPVNSLKWWEMFDTQFRIIADKIRENGMRVSMHPGQYTVLNSPDRDIVDRAIQDLNYHAKVLDCLRTGHEHKIVLHLGGVYKDKKQAMERFIENYHQLSESVKERLVIENDDKSYNICDVLTISQKLHIPVAFDNLHHKANPPDSDEPEIYWINESRRTWDKKDGVQKIHYSQQDYEKRPGSHSQSIRIKEFMDFCSNLGREDIDIMLEVKDKNLSAIKCSNCISTDKTIKKLEREWSRYKYSILEKSPVSYNEIRNLLKDKTKYPSVSFYDIMEKALEKPEEVGNAINAAQHVWGYFKDKASASEKEDFLRKIENYQNGKSDLTIIKRFLRKLTVKYKEQYLSDSYYYLRINHKS